jgi:hypothetical protein
MHRTVMNSLALKHRILSGAADVVPARALPRSHSAARFWGIRLVLVSVACWGLAPIIGFERALLVTTVIGFVIAVVGLRWPVLGLLGVGMLCALEPMASVYLQRGGLWRWNSFNYLLLAAMLLAVPLLLRMHGAQSRLLMLLVLLLGFEIGISSNPWGGLQNVFEIVVIFGMVVFFQKGARGSDAWYWLGVVTGASSALATVAFYSQQSTLEYLDMNALAASPLAGLFAVCLAILFTEDRWRARAVLLALGSLDIALIFLTGSRGALSMACVGVIFLLAWMRLSLRLTFLLAAVLLVGLIVTTQFGAREERAIGRVRLLFDPQVSIGSRTSGRINLAVGGWYIFRSNPLGVGTGGFGSSYARLGNRQGLSRFKEGVEMQAHAEWVKILVENGIPGAVLLGAFVVSFAATGWNRRWQGLFPMASWRQRRSAWHSSHASFRTRACTCSSQAR